MRKTRTRTRRRKQKGGDLCKGDTSSYKADKTVVLGKGAYGTVYGVKDNPNLAIKVQVVPIQGKMGEIFTQKLQNELAISTLAGDLGIGPKIHHLAICDTITGKSQTIIWVMDRIYGDTVYDFLGKYEDDLKKQGKTPAEIKKMEYQKRKEINDELVRMVDTLEKKRVQWGDIHNANVMYGSIDGGPPKVYIIDYGEFTFI